MKANSQGKKLSSTFNVTGTGLGFGLPSKARSKNVEVCQVSEGDMSSIAQLTLGKPRGLRLKEGRQVANAFRKQTGQISRRAETQAIQA